MLIFLVTSLWGSSRKPFKVPGTLADEQVLFLLDILPIACQAEKKPDSAGLSSL